MMLAGQIERTRATPIAQIIESRGIALCGKIERVGPSPRCGGRDRFSTNTTKNLWHCRGCNEGGDGIALVQFLAGCSFVDAVELLAGSTRTPPAPRRQQLKEAATHRDSASDAWTRIWRESVDPRGTLVEDYLGSRSLTLPEAAGDVIRYHGALWLDGTRAPGMVCLFRDVVSNEPCGIHRTFLDAGARKIARRMLGRAGGAAIKLSPDEVVITGLHDGDDDPGTSIIARESGISKRRVARLLQQLKTLGLVSDTHRIIYRRPT